MSLRSWVWGALGLAGVIVAGGAAFWYMQGKAMYAPGSVARAGVADPPAGAGARPGLWQVTPDIALRHFEVGSGEAVLVVHGGPGFPPLVPWRAAALTGDRLRWIFYQQRGCGESTRPIERLTDRNLYRSMKRLEGTLGLGVQIADIERIRRILGQDRLVLVGHSFGALIAGLYAAEFPEHVRALVLVSPAPLVIMPGDDPDLYELVGRRLPPALAPEYAAYRKQLFDFPTLMRKDERSLSTFFAGFRRFYGAAAGSGASASQIGGTGAEAGGWVTLAVYLSLGRRHDWRAALRGVRAPVLVLHGATDLQPESASRAVAAYFPRSRVQVLPGAGHFAFDQQPRAFADAVMGFLAASD